MLHLGLCNLQVGHFALVGAILATEIKRPLPWVHTEHLLPCIYAICEVIVPMMGWLGPSVCHSLEIIL